jgi:hypothetical protein
MSYQVDSYGNAYFPAGVSVASIPATTGTQNKVLVPGPGGRISSASIAQLITQSGGNLVSSVYGRTGAVVARQGDYNTDLVTEGQALYFTDSRARKALSVTTFNTSGPATYDSTTGIINIPQYGSGIVGNYVPVTRTITINGQTADLSANRIFSIDSMVYPSAGISLSNGTAWGTSIVNNSANWNTAFGWGNHAVAGYVPYTGANADVDLGSNNFTSKYLTANGAPALAGVLNLKQDAISIPKGDGFSSIAAGLSSFDFYGYTGASTYKYFQLRFDALTDNTTRLFTLPDASGTIALTTDLSSYVSLTGSYSNPTWLTDLDWAKITGAPAFLTSYTETDPVWTSEKINYYTKTAADARYLQSYTETDPVWTSEKANYALKTYVDTSISNLVDSAPGTLNTLNELAAALGDDANFSTTITTLIGTKEPAITAGTTAQYWRGDKTWQTLPVYTLSGLGGVPTTRTLTINGTSYDLSADRSWSITAGVSSVVGGSGISTSASGGTVTVSNTGILSALAGSGISVSTSGGTLSISNTGLLSGVAGSGISVSTSSGTLSISNTGLLSATAGSGISVSTSGGSLSISNTGILSIVAGSGISVATSSGTTTITNSITNNSQLTNGAGYITSSALSGYATQSWVTSQGYLTSLPSHNHDGRYIRLDTVNEQDGIVAYFRPATSGSYTMMKFESKVNQASDYGWILMQDDSQFTNGAPGTEDIRMTIGVFNDFQGPGVHSDELWFQGGARLVQNVGSWDTEYTTIIGTSTAKTNGTTYEWRVNNSSVMAISFAGVLSVGGNTVYHAGNLTNLNQLTNGPGYITGYTETDTLSTVVARGSTTSATISVGNSSLGTTGINILRGRLSFSNSYEANHSIYNNLLNLDGLGAWDGMKMNVYLGLDIRTGAHDSATNILAVRPTGVAVTGTLSATGNVTGANLSGTNTGDQTNISGLAASETLATVVGRGNSTGGGRPITLDNGGGSIIIKASAGGWSMGTYYRGSSDTILAGFGAYGGNNDLTWAWVGSGYESPWLTLNGSAVNSQVALQQGGNQVWHAGNLKVNYYQEDTSTLIPIGAYDKFVWGTGDRAAALIINDTAGARYAITAGSYDLSFYKHNSAAGTAVRAFYIDGNSTAGINNVTFETGIVSTNLTINRDLGTNDYSAIGQHNMQLRIRKASLDGGCAPRTLELGVLDNGTGIIQANHCGVGYNTLALNPVAGTVTVNGSTVWTQGNLTNLNQLTNGPGYITGYTETDTLGSVTGRGASTSTYSAFNGGLNVGSGKVGFRAGGATEFIQGEAWTMGIYGYNSNDGFLFFQRDTSDVAHPCFHIGGWNNAAYGGYSNADSMITLVRGDGSKSEGSTYATRGLSSSSYYSNIIKTTGGTIFRDSQSSHTFTGAVVTNGVSIHTPGDGGAGSQATVVAIRVRGLSGYESLELGTENNYDGVIRSYGNDIRYYAGHWRSVGNTSSENHSHYWYTSRNGSTDWSNHKMRLDHDGVLTVASNISTPGNLHANRSRLAFSSTATDANHSVYNNYNNIDGEGSFDGMKMNVYAGLLVRTGNASGAVPTTALDVTSGRTKIASGQLWCGESNSRDNAVGLVLNDGALHVRAHNDFYHKIWYYDGIAFGTNSAHGHFRFYAESSTQRGSTSGGATLRFDMDSTNGNFWAGGDITAYSDARVKKDVKLIENSIEKIQAIRGVTFLRTDAQEKDKEKRHAGVIAQEVLEVLPEVVTENSEGMYSVAYGNLVALLIEGMKEQQAQIEELKNEIKELKNK